MINILAARACLCAALNRCYACAAYSAAYPHPAPSPADTRARPEKANGFFRHFYTPHQAPRRSWTLCQVAFGLFLVYCLAPWASPPVALGLVMARTIGNSFPARTKPLTHKQLKFPVIGLAFGMNACTAAHAGREVFFHGSTHLRHPGAGLFCGGGGEAPRGAPHCGWYRQLRGSAIVAVGPVLRAKNEEILVALGTGFVLNAVVLFAFPSIGHALAMTQNQVWPLVRHCHPRHVVGGVVRSVGMRPYVPGLLLWVVISMASLYVMRHTV